MSAVPEGFDPELLAEVEDALAPVALAEVPAAPVAALEPVDHPAAAVVWWVLVIASALIAVALVVRVLVTDGPVPLDGWVIVPVLVIGSCLWWIDKLAERFSS